MGFKSTIAYSGHGKMRMIQFIFYPVLKICIPQGPAILSLFCSQNLCLTMNLIRPRGNSCLLRTKKYPFTDPPYVYVSPYQNHIHIHPWSYARRPGYIERKQNLPLQREKRGVIHKLQCRAADTSILSCTSICLPYYKIFLTHLHVYRTFSMTFSMTRHGWSV